MRDYDREQFQRGYGDEGYGEEWEDDEVQYTDEEGEEEGEYEEDDHKPTQEELEYLEIRQRLKEAARKRLRKEAAPTLGYMQDKKKQLVNDNFGSFFGPSKPAIAKRVIEERQSILETQQHLASMKTCAPSGHKKDHVPAVNGVKSGFQHHHPKVVNQVKQKAQKLKDTRDYSFLLSDDADISALIKDPPSRLAPASRSGALTSSSIITHHFMFLRDMEYAQPAKVSLKSPSAMSKPVKPVVDDRQDRSLPPKDRGMQKQGSLMMSTIKKPVLRSSDPRKQFGSSTSSSSKGPAGMKAPVQKSSSSVPNKGPIMPISSHIVSRSKQSVPAGQKAQLTKAHASVRKPQIEQRRERHSAQKAKLMPKQTPSSSKLQMGRSPKSMPSREDNLSKKRPVKRHHDEDDEDDAIRMIRSMFRYDPKRFRDDDDSDMEANFDDIQREERRSAKIGREEDERELKLIEEEERRERMRMEAKKRKFQR